MVRLPSTGARRARVLGYVVYAPPISVSTGPGTKQFMEGLALIYLTKVIYIGTRFDPQSRYSALRPRHVTPPTYVCTHTYPLPSVRLSYRH
jgi:hypothetical protein